MEKKVIYSEKEPEKKFLWLHTKNNNLVLEVFGNKGWESVGDDNSDYAKEINSLKQDVANIKKPKKSNPIEVAFKELSEDCSKKELLYTVNMLVKVLVKAGIIKF